jgi:hypothetical protein
MDRHVGDYHQPCDDKDSPTLARKRTEEAGYHGQNQQSTDDGQQAVPKPFYQASPQAGRFVRAHCWR